MQNKTELTFEQVIKDFADTLTNLPEFLSKEILKFSIIKIQINKEKKIVTVVFDDDVQIVKCGPHDEFDEKIGVALAIAQHIFGSKTQFKKFIDKHSVDVPPRSTDNKAITDIKTSTESPKKK